MLSRERAFQNFIGTDIICAVGIPSSNIVAGDIAFVGNIPGGSVGGVFHVDGSAEIIGGVQQFIHKLLNIGFVNPGGTQPHLDFRGFQVLGLGGPEGVHVASVHRVLCGSRYRTVCVP